MALGSAVAAFAQNNSDAQPEEKVLSFDTKEYDFGDLTTSSGPQTYKFVFTNISSKPIVVHNAISSCGCTVPIWDKQPIPPGKKGTIEVTYSNDQGPYPFNKTITIYVSGINRPIVLRIKGQVHERQMSIEELFTRKIGIIGIRAEEISIGYIAQGKRKVEESDIANMSNKPVQVVAVTDPAVSVSITPNPIPAKSIAKIKYTINTSAGPTLWGKTRYAVRFKADGSLQNGKLELVANINDNFDNMSVKQINNSPKIKLEKTYNELGEVKKGASSKHSFRVSNEGVNDLVIHKIDVDGKECSIISKMPIVVKAGSSATVDYSFNANYGMDEIINVMTIITNSVSKPTANFFVTGVVVK